MIVYDSTKIDFRNDVRNNVIEERIYSAFQRNLGHRTSRSEVLSWQNSMMYMSNILEDQGIPDDAGVSIEYTLPRSSKRIDFIITGKNKDKTNSMIIVELKQWQDVKRTDQPGIVKSFVGGGVRELTHPSYQAWSYAAYLEDFNDAVVKDNIQIKPCAYLHNCKSGEEIKAQIYAEDLLKAPVFIRDDSQKLSDFIKQHVRYGDDGIMYRIDTGSIKPTKKLADSFASTLKGNQEFIMIDDQKVVFEKAFKLATDSHAKNKNVLIVHGGPGTGKSVVAINLLVKLIEKQLNTQYVSKNSAPREVYSTKLTGVMTLSRYKSLFTGSGSFNSTDKNVFDALIVDEAHRLNEKSGLYSNLGENQIKEVINSSKCSFFFLDEDQRIAFSDIGSRDEIVRWATKAQANVTELELSSQFRCNGSNGYLGWLDNYLQIRETANTHLSDLDYDFRVFNSASEMHKEITVNNNKGFPSRTVAGYCWDWVSANDSSKFDIEVDDLKMKWNLKSHGSKWIIHPDSISEAGCIHTCQGLEVDYIGVLIGPDFVVRDGQVITNGHARPGRDKTIKGFRSLYQTNKKEAQEKVDIIIKNTYKTLMTRGMKGCYLFCTDKETNEYFKKIVVEK
jgi:uncharacterized protein